MERKKTWITLIVAVVLLIAIKSCASCSSPERVAKQDAKESARAIKKGDSEAWFESVKKRDKHFHEFYDEDLEKGRKVEKRKNIRYSDALDKYLDKYDAY